MTPPAVGAPSAMALHAALAARLNMQGARPAADPDEETLRFDVQLNVLEKLLASESGAWVRNVSSRTGARIQVKRDPAGKYHLEISGKPEQAVEAESLTEDAVRMLSAAAIADAADALASGGAASGPGALPTSAPGGLAPG